VGAAIHSYDRERLKERLQSQSRQEIARATVKTRNLGERIVKPQEEALADSQRQEEVQDAWDKV